MIFLFVSLVVSLIIIISFCQNQADRKANKQAQVLNSLPTLHQNNPIIQNWIIEYIKSNGGVVEYDELNDEFQGMMSVQLRKYLIDMVDAKIISHKLDTEKMTETLTLEGENVWK